ncbi:response regulator [Halorubrum sp. Boch-26]|uniref:response regulator n=1 Tax=Halorubrum sp. Boch-26 TaxID=2994426 RepID=UPI002468C673|nr:response regulator [Halorubrum sp. Boch-26]
MTNESIDILHVDDNTKFANVTETFLNEVDDRFRIHSETDPTAGFEYLLANDVDCVVSDQDMPGSTGIEFLEKVREEYPDLPFILYTGRGSEEVASEAIRVGVTDYLQKGSGNDNYELLANRVANAVEQARTRREAERTRTQMRAIVENTNDAVVIVDTTSTIQYANPAVESAVGYAPDELVGESLTLLMPTRLEKPHVQALNRYLETGEKSFDWESVDLVALHRDGREVPISISFSEFEQAGERRFIGVFSVTSSE